MPIRRIHSIIGKRKPPAKAGEFVVYGDGGGDSNRSNGTIKNFHFSPRIFTAISGFIAIFGVYTIFFSQAATPTSCPNESAGQCRPYDDQSPWNTEIPNYQSPATDQNSNKYIQAIKNNGHQLTSKSTEYTPAIIPVNNSTPKVQVMLLEGNYSWGNGYIYDQGDNKVDKTSTTPGQPSAYGSPQSINNVPIPSNFVASQIPGSDDAQVVFWNTDTGEEWAFWQFRPTSTTNGSIDDNTQSPNYTTTSAKWAATNLTKYHSKTDSSGNRYFGRNCGQDDEINKCAAPSTMGRGGRGAGTPYFAGLIRQWEVASGNIEHALSFAYNYPCNQFRYPAAKSDGTNNCAETTIAGQPAMHPPEGTRLQLDPSLTDAQLAAPPYNLTTPQQRTVAHAMQKYGLYIIDNSGRPKINLEYSTNPNWSNTTPLGEYSFEGIPWTAFQVVAEPCDPTAPGCTPPSSGPTANVWVDLRGNDAGSNCARTATKTNPDSNGVTLCKSIGAAWGKAQAGDTIRLVAGTYSTPTISGSKTSETFIIGEDGTKISGSFNPQANYMTLENVIVDVGSAHGDSIKIGGQNITFKDVSLYGPTVAMSVDGSNFTWKDGSLGQDGTIGGTRNCAGSNGQSVGDAEPITVNANNATIDGVRFNPQKADVDNANPTAGCGDGNFHLENVRVEGAQNVTIKNSWFLPGSDAGSGHIFVTNWQPSATASSGLKLINNIFEPVNGSYAVQMHSNVQTCNFTFGYNTFYQGMLIACTNPSGNIWIGNTGAYPGCSGTHTKNVFYSSSAFTCGSDTRVSGSSMSSLNLASGGRLTSASTALINGAEAGTGSDFCVGAQMGRDIDGDTRPQGAGCDAGADEYTGTVTPPLSDTTPPDTTISATTPANLLTQSPIPSTATTTASFTFSGTDNVGVASYECSFDAANATTGYSACTSPKPYGTPTGLSTGSHTFRVRAKDAAGNTDATPATITWTITATTTNKPGDVNADGSVNITDISIVLKTYGTTNTQADLDKNGTVNILDIAIILRNYGQ